MKRRRKHKRFKRRLEVEFSSGGRSYRGLSSDLSYSGLFIKTNNAFKPGTIIDIKLHLADAGISQLRGRVVRAMKTAGISINNGMGVLLLEKDSLFISFLQMFSPDTEAEGPAEDISSGHATGDKTDETAQSPSSGDVILLQCAQCKVKNKVPRIKVSQGPKCGKCGSTLIISLG
ncbi:MAG: PilZ domain-containing protein [Nitrospiraceae bacterium]|nr:MAG: PilZ domain-containing protein [Nitrospiraceae bacterium]